MADKDNLSKKDDPEPLSPVLQPERPAFSARRRAPAGKIPIPA
jgi:hypothetical protein